MNVPRRVRPKPVLRFYGSKFQLANWVVAQFPEGFEGLHYAEPFGGGAGVLLRKPRSRLETYNDIDSSLYTFFRVLRDHSAELLPLLRLTPYSREEYLRSLTLGDSAEPLEVARRVFVRYWQSISGTPVRPGWKLQKSPSGRYTTPPDDWNRAIENLPFIIERLRTVQLENLPAMELIERLDSAETLLYIDPPYLGDSRRFSESYPFELGSAEHRQLIGRVRGFRGLVLLSGYDSAEYREVYDSLGWNRVSRVARTNSGSAREEILWMNYDPPLPSNIEGK